MFQIALTVLYTTCTVGWSVFSTIFRIVKSAQGCQSVIFLGAQFQKISNSAGRVQCFFPANEFDLTVLVSQSHQKKGFQTPFDCAHRMLGKVFIVKKSQGH